MTLDRVLIVVATWAHFTGKVQCLQCGRLYPPVPKGTARMFCGNCATQTGVYIVDPGEYDGFKEAGVLVVRPGPGDRVWVHAWNGNAYGPADVSRADYEICKPATINDVREKCVGLGPGGPESPGYWSDAYCIRPDDGHEVAGERWDPKKPMYPVHDGGGLVPLAIVPLSTRVFERIARPFRYFGRWLNHARYALMDGRMP